MVDRIRFWLVHLVPVWLCEWLWVSGVRLGAWAPHILGRCLGAPNWKRVL